VDGQTFEIVVAHLDGFVQVELRGDLDHSVTVHHAKALQEVADLRTRVVVDLARLGFIDSAGLAFLVRLSVVHDGPIRLDNVPYGVARVLHFSGLEDLFEYVASN
jgi:anti-anti-sigma factor